LEGADIGNSAHTDLENGGHSLTGSILLTPEQAAASLAIGRTKVFELLRSGELESVRIGSCRRIPSDALEDYVFRLRRSAPKPEIL
jgi:excisionase family DNA binding protein